MKMQPISTYCTALPQDLARHLDDEYAKIQEHYLLSEYADLLVDSGRLCEAIMRYLEWKVKGSYTVIDGRSKPNRSQVVNATRQCATLEPSIRQQAVNLIETVLDFRNNRNAAHLGAIDPSVIDAATAYQMLSWVVAEIIRLEAQLSSKIVQELINKFAERPIPVIYTIAGNPTVLDTNISSEDEVLVLLYDNNSPVDASALFKWVHHGNITRWRKNVLQPLSKDRLIMLDHNLVHILPAGIKRAEIVLTNAAI
jgi:hypothetical protein